MNVVAFIKRNKSNFALVCSHYNRIIKKMFIICVIMVIIILCFLNIIKFESYIKEFDNVIKYDIIMPVDFIDITKILHINNLFEKYINLENMIIISPYNTNNLNSNNYFIYME